MTISEVAQGFTSADADDDRWVDPRLVRAAAGADSGAEPGADA